MAGTEQYKVSRKVVLFDGVCNLCNATVQQLIKLDRQKELKFASLQSDFGQKVLLENHFDQQKFDSFLYLRDDEVYTSSDAALEVAKDLGGIWRVTSLLRLIPKLLRDGLYDFIARNRYKWFGQNDQCTLPTPELRDRFLD